jgi:hypothetical protein
MTRLCFNRIQWFIAGMLFAAIVFLLSGCTTAEMTFPDGRNFKYSSNIFDKKFSEMTFYPDGSFAIVGYQSDAASAIRLAELAIGRIPVKP